MSATVSEGDQCVQDVRPHHAFTPETSSVTGCVDGFQLTDATYRVAR
jgi:hypothetical protein